VAALIQQSGGVLVFLLDQSPQEILDLMRRCHGTGLR
jgi:hypothetical protein